jgi:hypothetical protein
MFLKAGQLSPSFYLRYPAPSRKALPKETPILFFMPASEKRKRSRLFFRPHIYFSANLHPHSFVL